MTHIRRALQVLENFRGYPVSPGYVAQVNTDMMKAAFVNWAEDFTDDLADTMIESGGTSKALGYVVKFGDDLAVTYLHKKFAEKVGLEFKAESLLWALHVIFVSESDDQLSPENDDRIQQAFDLINYQKTEFLERIERDYSRAKRLAHADKTSHGWFDVLRPTYELVITQLKLF